MVKESGRPISLNEKPFTYCPGCGHGIVHRLLAEIIDELGIRENTIGVAYVGCGGMIYDFMNFDMIFPLHGRAPAVATGVKRVRPDSVVFTYQGDGDLSAIGTAEIIHAACRGENLTTIFVNNGVYGMTGGQMAPTTLIGQVTTTTPKGRIANYHGYPIRLSEMVAQLDGVCYVERVAVDTPKNIVKTKKALGKGFQNQLDKKGFSLIEVISPCPTGWGMTPVAAYKHVEERILPFYKLGILKER